MAHSLNNAKKAQFMRRESSYATRGSRTGANLLGWDLVEDMPIDQLNDRIEQWEIIKSEIEKLKQLISDKKKNLGWLNRPHIEIGRMEQKNHVPLDIQTKADEIRKHSLRLADLTETASVMSQKLRDLGYILGKSAEKTMDNYDKEKYEYYVAFSYIAQKTLSREICEKIHLQAINALNYRKTRTP